MHELRALTDLAQTKANPTHRTNRNYTNNEPNHILNTNRNIQSSNIASSNQNIHSPTFQPQKQTQGHTRIDFDKCSRIQKFVKQSF